MMFLTGIYADSKQIYLVYGNKMVTFCIIRRINTEKWRSRGLLYTLWFKFPSIIVYLDCCIGMTIMVA